MKNLIFVTAFAVTSLSIVACTNGNKSSNVSSQDTSVSKTEPLESMDTTTNKTGVDAKTASSLKGIFNGYLSLKNALTQDNGQQASDAANLLITAFNGVDNASLNQEQKKSYTDIADDAKEMSKHIADNPDKLAHQREHFEMLSKDMYDLVKVFGTAGQPLYQDFCPMYNDNKGAYWLSETKEIKNPYLGNKMSTCGSVKEELN